MEALSFVIGVFGIVLAIYHYVKGNDKQQAITNQLIDLQKKHEELKKERPEIQLHHVIMDGMSGSGKTTFIARLISPVTNRESLEKIAATTKSYMTFSVPICWEKKTKTKKALLHELRFTDIAGERRSTFINALYGLPEEALKDTKVISVILWDISRVEQNYEYLSNRILETTYGNDRARAVIKSIIVFFNKADRIDDKVALDKIIDSERRKIKKIFHDIFDKGYGDIKFYVGSALEGSGLHYCYGEILKNLNLEHNYEEITGNPLERRDETI